MAKPWTSDELHALADEMRLQRTDYVDRHRKAERALRWCAMREADREDELAALEEAEAALADAPKGGDDATDAA